MENSWESPFLNEKIENNSKEFCKKKELSIPQRVEAIKRRIKFRLVMSFSIFIATHLIDSDIEKDILDGFYFNFAGRRAN